MKFLQYGLPSLLIALVLGLMIYQGLITRELESRNLMRGVLLIAGAVVTLLRVPRHQTISPKIDYQKAYGEFIGQAFYDDPKLEKQFYKAVHSYAQSKSSKALRQLEKLRKECRRTEDLRAVTVFTALCLDVLRLYEQAVSQYDAALRIRNSSTLHSNMGLCYQRLGKYPEAEACYNRAIDSNPKNAYAFNNLSALYFLQENYDEALDLAVQAIEIDATLKQALSTAAVCSGVLGYEEDYKKYYRQAVSAGYDGKVIKDVIAQLDPTL